MDAGLGCLGWGGWVCLGCGVGLSCVLDEGLGVSWMKGWGVLDAGLGWENSEGKGWEAELEWEGRAPALVS